MQFNYGPTNNYPLDVRTAMYHPYQFRVSYVKPAFEIVTEKQVALRPFEDQQRLLDSMFKEDRESPLDPLNFPGEKARLKDRQIHFLLDHLAARHAISYQIRKNIDYQESSLGTRLDEIRTCPFPMGMGSKQATELEKQLLELSKERWAEEVGCWRDTGRIFSDMIEHWSEYADQTRKARLLDFGL